MPTPPPGKSKDDPSLEELRLELERTREQLTATQKERDDLAEQLKSLQGKFDELQKAFTASQSDLQATQRGRDDLTEQLKSLRDKFDELQKAFTASQSDLQATTRERDNLVQQQKVTAQKNDELQAKLLTQQEELGRLKEVASTVDALRQERDALRAELNDTRSAIPTQVKDQVRTQLSDATQAHTDEVNALQSDRERLQARVSELEQGAGVAQAPSMSTADLAGHFAGVLNDLGNRPAGAGSAFAAALTGLNVQAKGLLRANDQGEVEIVTADAGAVPAEQLSTVAMELKLLPRLQNQVPPEPEQPQ
jgi:predicted nuclease with TOPRIM domain